MVNDDMLMIFCLKCELVAQTLRVTVQLNPPLVRASELETILSRNSQLQYCEVR
jgi:hypothetical protein